MVTTIINIVIFLKKYLLHLATALNFSGETEHVERSEAVFVHVPYKYCTHCGNRNFVAEEAGELQKQTQHSFIDAPKITVKETR